MFVKTKRVNELRIGDTFFDKGIEYCVDRIQRQGIYFSVWAHNVMGGQETLFLPWSGEKFVVEL